MGYANGHKSNRIKVDHRRRPADRVQGSGFRIHPSSFILHPSPSGVTLVEMLIVISIIVILTVATLKVITPAGERRVREAARAVNVYISSARNRAIETGRPCGVIFRRANVGNFPTASTVLDQCEVPPTYAGDQMDAVVKVQDWTYRTDAWTDPFGNNHPWPYWDNDTSKPPPILRTRVLKVWVRTNDFSNNVVRRGDLVQLGGQGPYYTIIEDPDSGTNFRRTVPVLPSMPPTGPPPFPPDFPLDANGYIDFAQGVDTSSPADNWIDNYVLTLVLDGNMLQASPWPTFVSGGVSNPISFNILRQLVKSSVSPLQLPAGAVVDLDFSGTDYQTFQNPPGDKYDVAIIFSSNGAVEGYYWNNQPCPAPGPIFMLVGSRSRVRDFVAQPLPAVPNLNDLPNWADLSSVWVTINYQTGMAVSDENYAINFATEKDPNPLHNQVIPWDKMIAADGYNNWAYFINLSRYYARESMSMGGR